MTLTKNERAVMDAIAETFNSWRTGDGIANELELDSQGVHRALASLVQKGLVVKRKFDDGKLAPTYVKLTPAGIKQTPNYRNPLAGWWK